MKITFYGATKTVTGSNFLVEAAGKKFLVDCGMYQGQRKLEDKNYEDFPYDVSEIDFMLLTHAHIDHSGRIPKLYNAGYRNPVIATKATCDLCGIMLPDSGHIQEMEVEWKNRKRQREGQEPLIPMYTAEDATKSLEIFKPVKYDEEVIIDQNIKAKFRDAGHMLGSSIIELWVTEDGKTEKVVFSGDLGNNDLPLLKPMTLIKDTDYLVMESTYGGRLHKENANKAERFLDIVSETIDNGGSVIIPSFAVGRTQEILYELNEIKERTDDKAFAEKYEKLMKIPVFVDSPLAISATEIFYKNTELFDDKVQEEMRKGDHPLEFPGLEFTKTAEESKALNTMNKSSIIISASGMCEVGRIKHHLKHHIWNPSSTILFVGYQAEGTLGRKIVEGAKTVKIFGEEIAVNARIEYIEGYSGHADQNGLLRFVDGFTDVQPRHIFLVHGEEQGQQILKAKIVSTTHIPVSIPDYAQSFELNDAEVKKVANENVVDTEENVNTKRELLDRIDSLTDELNKIKSLLKEMYK